MKTSIQQNFFFLSLLLLACFILSFSFIKQSQDQVDRALGSVNSSPPDFIPEIQVPKHGDYALPHPGILPTNPLYAFKMIRDRIGLTLTRNQEKRGALLLHLADKRIAAARVLLAKGEINKAIETATKAEIYFFRSINSHKEYDTLKKAALKHEEIIEEIQQLATGVGKDQADHLYHNLSLHRLQIVTLSGEPFGYPRPEDAIEVATESASPENRAPNGVPAAEPYL